MNEGCDDRRWRTGSWLALEWVLLRLFSCGIAWGVFGGLAVRFYGGPRPVSDIDILVSPGCLERAAMMLGTPIAMEVSEQVRLRRATRWGVDLCGDVVAAVDGGIQPFTLDVEMARRRHIKLWYGMPLFVIAPEDTLVLKAIAQRGPEDGKRDVADVAAILQRQQRLDRGYLMWRAEVCGAADRVRSLIAQLE
jgi:hypothetical protein